MDMMVRTATELSYSIVASAGFARSFRPVVGVASVPFDTDIDIRGTKI